MSLEKLFPLVAAVWCSIAGVIYVGVGDWRHAVIWFAFAAADIALVV
jgi:hypothetical protein